LENPLREVGPELVARAVVVLGLTRRARRSANGEHLELVRMGVGVFAKTTPNDVTDGALAVDDDEGELVPRATLIAKDGQQVREVAVLGQTALRDEREDLQVATRREAALVTADARARGVDADAEPAFARGVEPALL
jgi:hypothetical protein